MKSRCFNQNTPEWKSYGGRGIGVCERWLKFGNFLADMGERPTAHSIDRIDNNSGYTPENCRWATRVQQANNKRSNINIAYQGVTKSLGQWAARLGINYGTLWTRYRAGDQPPRLFRSAG
jgi:hypothetical protein